MWSYRVLGVVWIAVPVIVWGCSRGPVFIAKDEPWRADEERQCLASGYVRSTPFLLERTALGGPEPCGALRPFEMSAAADGYVQLKPPAMLRCPMIPAVERWVRQVVIPAARRNLGADVVELKVAASYSCRPMNGIYGGRLSEHGHANAIDISAFELSDGRKVTVKQGWRGEEREHAFLAEARAGACDLFTTVLGPGADPFHHDHFHLDLARHGRGGSDHICK